MATAAENEQISRRLTEGVFGERDFDLIDEHVAEDTSYTTLTCPIQFVAAKDIEKWLKEERA